MFLRAKIGRKDGKQHRTYSIVENRRVSGGRVVQRHALYLGEINDCRSFRGAQDWQACRKRRTATRMAMDSDFRGTRVILVGRPRASAGHRPRRSAKERVQPPRHRAKQATTERPECACNN